MLRRKALVTFALALGTLVACGRQITPDNLNVDLAGRMVIRFRTNAPMDFTKYSYAIVIDTCGNGTPLPQAFATTFTNYSFSFFVGGQYGTAGPVLFQYVLTPGTSNPLNPQAVPLGASTTQFVPNSNQQNNEFQLTFVRAQLDNPLQVAQPCPNATGGPGPTPSAPPSSSPSSQPSSSSPVWSFNFFSIDNATGRILDSLGIGGALDTSFNGLNISIDQASNTPIFRQVGSSVASDPPAAIAGGEIDNYP